MNFKVLGSILLIVGTSIGAGMLALPITTAAFGFIGSISILVLCWAIMTGGAFLLLEVNLWLPQNTHIISMAKKTIGPVGRLAAGFLYLFLLYALLCAYISGGSDLIQHLLLGIQVNINHPIAAILFTIIFGGIVYCGIIAVDYANRGLMLGKFITLILLLIFLTPFVSGAFLMNSHLAAVKLDTALMVTMTSFGFATIIPSVRAYLKSDLKKIKKAILLGSLIPLICYIAWDAVIMGVLPIDTLSGLSNNTASGLMTALSIKVKSPYIVFCITLFTSICMLTSFLGVALSLADFLADGLALEKQGRQNLIIHLITFVPALLLVIFKPNVFLSALEYAGIACLLLLVALPTLMVWQGRKKFQGEFKMLGGKCFLISLGLFSLLTAFFGLVN